MAEVNRNQLSNSNSQNDSIEFETITSHTPTDDDAGFPDSSLSSSSDSPSVFNVTTYTLLISLIYACCSAGTAIIIGTVTTLQRAFGFSSTQIGFIQASYSVGYAGSILFIGHFAEKSHKPRWVAVGAAAVSISCLLPLIPHFLIWLPAHRRSRSIMVANDLLDEMNNGSRRDVVEPGLCNPGDNVDFSTFLNCPNDTADAVPTPSATIATNNGIAYVLFAIASVFAGFGNSPLNTVGMTYIDDNVSKQESAFYMGIPMSMYAVGPVVGFFFHAYVMQFHADIFLPETAATAETAETASTTTSRSGDSDFVGAWWISYLIVGCTISLLAFFALSFPKRLKHRSKNARKYEEENSKALLNKPRPENLKEVIETISPEGFLHQIKTLLTALVNLLSNPVYLSTLIGSACFSTGILAHFNNFIPILFSRNLGRKKTLFSNRYIFIKRYNDNSTNDGEI